MLAVLHALLARVATWRYASDHFIFSLLETSNSLILSNQDLPENQCIFVRGFRATRIARIFPRLQAAAGPVQVPFEDAFDAELQLISIPGDTQVNVTISHFQPLSDVSKYQDPFYTLLKYIAIVSVLESKYIFVT